MPISKQWKKEQVCHFFIVVLAVDTLLDNGSLVLFSAACLPHSCVTLIPKASVDVVPQKRMNHGIPKNLIGILRSIVIGGNVAGVQGVPRHPGLDAGAAPVRSDQPKDPLALSRGRQSVRH